MANGDEKPVYTETMMQILTTIREVQSDIRYLKEREDDRGRKIEKYEERINALEQAVADFKGKYSIILIGIGAVISFGINKLLG